ncbi:MAG TPA: hypothetical protein VE954_16315, partial [Oligoflexus sp.]|uniref:hypothetical protein n=1 Tax=Oligoflexus sp. TaxID=1971216 RepID=UPI002D70FB44
MKIAWIILLAMLGACGRVDTHPGAPESALDELMERGRLHRFMPRQASESLALTGHAPEIHSIQQLGDSPYASWMQFDVRLMPDVAAFELELELKVVAEQYGAMLSSLRVEEWLPAERFMRRDEGRVFLNYWRKVQGLPVRDNVLQLVFVERVAGVYRLSEIQSNITGPAPSADTPREGITQDDALGWLEDLTGRTDLVVERRGAEWIPFLEEGHFHWQKAIVFEWSMDGEHYQATLLPEAGVWLDAWPLAVHAKPVLTRALKRSYAEDGPREYPLSFSAVNGPAGNFALGAEAWLPQNLAPSTIGLTGPRAMIFDNLSPDSLTLAGLQEQEASYFLPDNDSRLAAVNAFVAVQRINRFARQFLNGDDAAFLNHSLVVNVNLAEQSCNAFYSPKQQKLLLYKEGKGCANMALLNDVIYHEWGHALDDHVGRNPGIRDPAFSEGMADVVAAFYNDDPAIAPYFVFDDPRPIRTLTEARVYPDDIGPMHYEGGIISSTFWELRQLLIERYGPHRGAHVAGRLFFRHLLAVDSYLESYAAVLRVDDNDSNPATPGPNHCLINAVFARHGLTAAEPCEDQPLALEPAAPDLHLALLDAGPEDNAVHVLASAPAADAMALCLGARATCE